MWMRSSPCTVSVRNTVPSSPPLSIIVREESALAAAVPAGFGAVAFAVAAGRARRVTALAPGFTSARAVAAPSARNASAAAAGIHRDRTLGYIVGLLLMRWLIRCPSSGSGT